MKQQHTIFLSLIVLLTFLVYFQTFSFDFVNWDDDYYVINNLQVTNPTIENLLLFFTEGNTANYHPLTMLSLTFNYWIGGEKAGGYHIFNLLFHLINTALLYTWIRKVWPDYNLLPLFVAGLFALHPMHVESVAWISSRKDVLFICFYLSGLLAYQEYIVRKEQNKYLWFALLFFVLSGLSKPTSVVFPIHLLLVDYLVSRDLKFQLIVEKIPFFTVSLLIGLATVLVQTDAGAVSIEAYSVIERIQLGSYALNLYLFKFFWPSELSSFYPYPQRPFELIVSLAPLLLAAITGVFIWKWRSNRPVVFGLLFFISSIILLIQLVTVGSTIISERYTYLPYIGLSIGVYFMLHSMVLEKMKTTNAVSIGVIVLLVVFSLLSYSRVKVWENGETLWTDAIQKFPQVAGSWGGRGVYYRLEKRYTEALKDLNMAVELNPNEAMFYSNRGNIYFDLGEDDLAFRDYNNCLILDSLDENAYANRGAIYGRKGQYNSAVQDLSKALEINQNFTNAYMNRGIIYSQMNQRMLAKADFKSCLLLEPEEHGVWNALAIEHQHLGEFDSSIVALNRAVELAPTQGVYYMNLGISYRMLRDQQNANSNFDRAKQYGIDVNPGYYQPI